MLRRRDPRRQVAEEDPHLHGGDDNIVMFKRINETEGRRMPNAPEIELDDFDWTDWADDPYPLYRRLRDEAPVYWDERNRPTS